MKKIIALLIGTVMILSLVACGGGRADAQYVGKYVSVAGTALGLTMTGEDISGFGLELKEGGKASITIDGETDSIKWTNDDTNITLKVSGQEVVGEIGKDTIKFVNMLDMGLDLTMAKEGTDAADPVHYLPENDKLMVGTWKSYSVSDVLGDDASGAVSPEALVMTFTADHKADISYLGKSLGTHKWSILGTFGSFDDSDLEITWDIAGNEIEATYSGGEESFIFKCKK